MIRARRWLRGHASAIVLVAIMLLIGGAVLLRQAQQQDTYVASQRQQQAQQLAVQHREQAAQQRAGALIELRLCTTLGRLAANKPPAGNPAKNPSRAYDQNNHAILAQLGPDLGCGLRR